MYSIFIINIHTHTHTYTLTSAISAYKKALSLSPGTLSYKVDIALTYSELAMAQESLEEGQRVIDYIHSSTPDSSSSSSSTSQKGLEKKI
jgi:hypothetical protein